MIERFAKRDWGWWLVLYKRPHFKLKILRFKAGQSISMQRHRSRNELWLFLKGRGNRVSGYTVPRDPVTIPVRKGDYWLVKQLEWHRYTATKPTLVLEVQFGSLCSESDIERRYEQDI